MQAKRQLERGPVQRTRGRSRSASPERPTTPGDSIRVATHQTRQRSNPAMQASNHGRSNLQSRGSPYAGVTKRKPGRPHASTIVFEGFPDEDAPIDPDIPLEDLIYYHPNHLRGSQLARLATANWTATMIVEAMDPEAQRQFFNRPATTQPHNALTKRLSNIRKKLDREAKKAARGTQAARNRGGQRSRREVPSSQSPPTRSYQPPPQPPSTSSYPVPAPPPFHPSNPVGPDVSSQPPRSAPPGTNRFPRHPRASNARPVYRHRATFKVYVPYDSKASKDSTLTKQNIYLPYDPPHVSAEDPLGILYQDLSSSAPMVQGEGSTLAPREAVDQDISTDEEFANAPLYPTTSYPSPMPTAQILSPFHHNRTFTEQQNDLNQVPERFENGQQQVRSSRNANGGAFLGQNVFMEGDHDYAGEFDAYHGTEYGELGLEPDPNFRWSPTKGQYVARTPPGLRRSPRNTWGGLH